METFNPEPSKENTELEYITKGDVTFVYEKIYGEQLNWPGYRLLYVTQKGEKLSKDIFPQKV